MFCAQVAQLVEQGTENPCVGGSIPPLGTTLFNHFFIDQRGLVTEPGKSISGKISI